MVGGVQDMARKVYLLDALRMLGCTACIVAACAAIAALKYKCMDHDAYTFAGSVCQGDSQMRAVVSALLTFALFFMALLVADAIEALRSAMLARNHGINEGVYVAMVAGGSMALRLRACFTCPYAPLMLMIALFQYGPEASQTLSSLAIKTVPVYVNTSAVATLPPGPYRYNDTPGGLLGATLNAPPAYSTALYQIRGMSQYEGGASSTIESSDTVTTAVARTGASPALTGNGHTALPSDVVIFNDTIGNVTSHCYVLEPVMNYTEFEADATSSIRVTAAGGKVRQLFATNVTVSNNMIQVASQITFEAQTKSFTWKCDSSVRFDICTIAFGLRSHDVQVLQSYSPDSTVQLSSFSRLIKQSIIAPEYFSNMLLAKADMLGDDRTVHTEAGLENFLNTFYFAFAQGLYSSGQMNLLHAKVATAVADGLDRFWALQFIVSGNVPDLVAVANEPFTLDQLRTWGLTAPVYGLQLQAFIPTRYVWALLGALLSVAWILAMVGLLSLVAAPINVKSANDISLMLCVEPRSLAARAAEVINALLTCLQKDSVIASIVHVHAWTSGAAWSTS